MQRLLANDIRTGTKSNILKFFLAALFAFASCLYFKQRVEIYCLSRNISEITLSGQDYILYVFGGLAKDIREEAEKFEIPFVWMTVQMLACGCVCLYPVRGLNTRGTIFLMQSGSRVKWWLSKCIWSVIQLLLLYLCVCAGIILAAGLSGWEWGCVHGEVFRELEEITAAGNVQVGFRMIFYQILYSIAITMMQINISLMTGAVWGVICVVSYHILSVCVAKEWILGNVSMLYRMEGIVIGGQNVLIGLIGCIILSAVSVGLGLKYFKSCDILQKT